MIQPYFKPDVNPNMPSFAVFYNGFYQERSKMNMQMMNLMLQQASPEYLNKMIDRTQDNISELQKQRNSILKMQAQEASKIAMQLGRDTYAREEANAKFKNAEIDARLRGLRDDKTSSSAYKKAQNRFDLDRAELTTKISSMDFGGNTIPTVSKFKEYYKTDTKKAIEKIKDFSVEELAHLLHQADPKKDADLILNLKGRLGGVTSADEIFEKKYPNLYATPTTTSSEALLSPEEHREALQYIDQKTFETKNKSNRDKYEDLSDDKKENVKKALKQLLQGKRFGVPGKVTPPKATDFQPYLDEIDEKITSESEKLGGYYLRYGAQQQDALTKIFEPFEKNYRTENLFKVKSPEVKRREEEIRALQYGERTDTPSGFENLKYNTEYLGPGGTMFGVTKVGDQDIPYMFEGGEVYEFDVTDPSYSSIVDLLKKQDELLGGY